MLGRRNGRRLWLQRAVFLRMNRNSGEAVRVRELVLNEPRRS